MPINALIWPSRGPAGRFVRAVLLLLAGLPAAGHEAPGDMVHMLTHRMETHGATARLLVARAYEYQYLAQWDAAVADFEAALERQPRYGAAVNGLAHTLLRQGELDRAMAAARRGLALEETPEREGPYHAVIAEARSRGADWDGALDAWRAALRSGRPEVDWFLGEAACLARLDRFAERADALQQATRRNPSAVLHRAWIEALVDAGAAREALPAIEERLARAHWKATWLLLRARIHALAGDTEARNRDATAALEEINARWGRKTTGRDPYLLAQAGLAFALLGDSDTADAHLDQARKRGVSEARLYAIGQAIRHLPGQAP